MTYARRYLGAAAAAALLAAGLAAPRAALADAGQCITSPNPAPTQTPLRGQPYTLGYPSCPGGVLTTTSSSSGTGPPTQAVITSPVPVYPAPSTSPFPVTQVTPFNVHSVDPTPTPGPTDAAGRPVTDVRYSSDGSPVPVAPSTTFPVSPATTFPVAPVAGGSPFPTLQQSAPTATMTSIPSSTTSSTIAAANANRKCLIVYNNGGATLDLAFGTVASTTLYTVPVAPGGIFELGALGRYTGQVSGIWSSVSGTALATECS